MKSYARAPLIDVEHDLSTSKYDNYDENYLEPAFRFANWQEFKKAKRINQLLFLNRWFWILLGKFLSILYALGCAMTIGAAAVAFLCGVTGVMWPGIIGGIVMAACGFIFNIKITWFSTPKILLDFFGRGKFFKGLLEYTDKAGKRQQLSSARKKWIMFGIVCAIASSITYVAIGWGSIQTALTIILGVTAASIPPALVVITAVILIGLFVCTTAMLLKEMSLMLGKNDILVRLKNLWGKITRVATGQYFKNLYVTFEQEHPNNPTATKKAFFLQMFKDSSSLMITLAVVGLTIVGLFMTEKTGMADMATILIEKLNVDSIAANTLAIINCLVFAFSGDLPFAIGTSTHAANSINKWIFAKKQARDAAKAEGKTYAPESTWETCKNFLQKFWRPIHIINAIGNGLIAMKTFMGNLVSGCQGNVAPCTTCVGDPQVGMMTFSLITGFLNSFTSGFHGDDDNESPINHCEEKKSSTQKITSRSGRFQLLDAVRTGKKSRNDNAANDESQSLLMKDMPSYSQRKF